MAGFQRIKQWFISSSWDHCWTTVSDLAQETPCQWRPRLPEPRGVVNLPGLVPLYCRVKWRAAESQWCWSRERAGSANSTKQTHQVPSEHAADVADQMFLFRLLAIWKGSAKLLISWLCCCLFVKLNSFNPWIVFSDSFAKTFERFAFLIGLMFHFYCWVESFNRFICWIVFIVVIVEQLWTLNRLYFGNQIVELNSSLASLNSIIEFNRLNDQTFFLLFVRRHTHSTRWDWTPPAETASCRWAGWGARGTPCAHACFSVRCPSRPSEVQCPNYEASGFRRSRFCEKPKEEVLS